MTINRIDHLYRTILLSKYFVKGWGKPENFKQLFEFRKKVIRRETCYKLVSKDFPVSIDKKEETNDYKLLEGHFISPFGQYLPDLVPDESKKAYFQVLIPKAWDQDNSEFRPMVLHMAGTGDHYYWRRRNLIAKPLLKESNIGSIILENPFYGARKPEYQVRSILHNVSDIFVMGGCLMLEALVLFHWCEREGFGPLGVTGMSMGGHMASLAATNWPHPLVLVPCLSWSTASGVFTEGVLSGAIPWDLLEDQYTREHTYRDEIEKMMTRIDEEAYKAGEHFARTYPSSLISMGQEFPAESSTASSQPDSRAPSSSTKPNTTPSTDAKTNITKSTDAKTNITKSTDTKPSITPSTCTKPNITPSSTELNSVTSSGSSTLPEKNSSSNPQPVSADKRAPQSSTKPEVVMSSTQPDGVTSSISTNLGNITSSISTKLHVMTSQERHHLISKIENKLRVLTDWNAPEKTSLDVRAREGFHFMRGIMNECTHLANFTPPVDPALIIAVCARDDGYVPREGVMDLRDIWPGCEVRYIEGGHVQAFLLHQKDFRNAIRDAFERARVKMNKNSHLKNVSES